VISSFIFANYLGTEISKTFLCHNKKLMVHLACRGINTTNIFVKQLMILDSTHDQKPKWASRLMTVTWTPVF